MTCVIQAIEYADGMRCAKAGQYLKAFDPDAMTTILDALLNRCGDDDKAKLMLLGWFKHNHWRLSLDRLPVNVPLPVGLAHRAAVNEHGSVKAAIAALRAEAVRCVKAN
jgi:hypothetical protein